MNKNILLSTIAACGLLLSSYQVSADTVALKVDHPDRHIVVKGDTLWDISARFLKDPWQWPTVWNVNPAIKNPHLIYPGDVILLRIVEGQPVLWLERDQDKPAAATASTHSEQRSVQTSTHTADGLAIVRLSPQIRASLLEEEAIPTIPSDAIKQFLKFPRIVSKRELEDAGYIVASEDGGLLSGSDDKIYARGIEPQEQTAYDIVRVGKTYRSQKGWGSDVLGYEMLRIADARVTRYDDTSTMIITKTNREVLIGDRLLPATHERELSLNYLPHAPDKKVNGKIIAVLDGVSRIGQYHTVVVDLGERDNIETGHVLAIYQTGETISDKVSGFWSKKLTLPDERAGTLMIVQPFEKISYALVMEASKDMKVNDSITNP
jgi:LysM repeat protein